MKIIKSYVTPLLAFIAFAVTAANTSSPFLYYTLSFFSYDTFVKAPVRPMNLPLYFFRTLVTLYLFIWCINKFWKAKEKCCYCKIFAIYTIPIGLCLLVNYCSRGTLSKEYAYFCYFCFYSFLGLFFNEEFWVKYYKLLLIYGWIVLFSNLDAFLYGKYDTVFSILVTSFIVSLFLARSNRKLSYVFLGLLIYIILVWATKYNSICGIGYFVRIPAILCFYYLTQKKWKIVLITIPLATCIMFFYITNNPSLKKNIKEKIECRIDLITNRNMNENYLKMKFWGDCEFHNTYGNIEKPSPHNVFFEAFFIYGIFAGIWYIIVNLLCIRGLWNLQNKYFWICMFFNYTLESVIEGNLLCQRSFIFIHILGLIAFFKSKKLNSKKCSN